MNRAEAHSLASGYAWAWQDCECANGKGKRDCTDSFRFATAYAMIAGSYDDQIVLSFPPVEEAHKQWREHGFIEVLSGRGPLRFTPVTQDGTTVVKAVELVTD